MGAIVNGQYYLSNPTDILTPAEKAAHEAKEREQRNYQQQIEHSKNLYDTDKGMDQLEALKGVVSFSKTLASAYSTYKQSEAAREKQDTKKQVNTNTTLDYLTSDPKHKDVVEKIFKWDADAEGLSKQGRTFKGFVQEQFQKKLISKELRDYFIKSSKDELLRGKIWQGAAIVENAEAKWRAKLNDLQGDEKLAHLAEFPDIASRQHDFRKFVHEELGLFLNEDTILSNFSNTIQEKSENIGASARLLYDRKDKIETVVNFTKGLTAALTKQNEGNLSGIDNDPRRNAVTVWTQDTLEDLKIKYNGDTTKAKSMFTAMTIMAITRKQFRASDLADLKQGQNRGHPAGEDGRILLSDANFKDMEQAILNTDKQIVIESKAQLDDYYAETFALARSGQIDATEFDNRKNRLLTLGMNPNGEKFKSLTNVNLRSQDQNSYKVEKATFLPTLQTGRTEQIKDQIKNVKNIALKTELQQEALKLDQSKKENNWPTNNFDNDAHELMKSRLDITLAVGEKLPYGNAQAAKNFISQAADRFYMDEYSRAEPGDTLIGARARKRLDDYITGLGFYETDQNSPAAGILTPDKRGNFNNFGYYNKSRLELNRKSNVDQILGEINRVRNNPSMLGTGENYKQRVLNAPGLLTNDELIAVKTNTQLNQLKTWPPDVILKAELLGVAPSELVRAQLNTLINSKDKGDQKIVELFKMKGLLENIPTVDVKLRKAIESTGDKNLLSTYEWGGILRFSDTQYQRLLSYEKSFEQKSTFEDTISRLKKDGKSQEEIDKWVKEELEKRTQ